MDEVSPPPRLRLRHRSSNALFVLGVGAAVALFIVLVMDASKAELLCSQVSPRPAAGGADTVVPAGMGPPAGFDALCEVQHHTFLSGLWLARVLLRVKPSKTPFLLSSVRAAETRRVKPKKGTTRYYADVVTDSGAVTFLGFNSDRAAADRAVGDLLSLLRHYRRRARLFGISTGDAGESGGSSVDEGFHGDRGGWSWGDLFSDSAAVPSDASMEAEDRAFAAELAQLSGEGDAGRRAAAIVLRHAPFVWHYSVEASRWDELLGGLGMAVLAAFAFLLPVHEYLLVSEKAGAVYVERRSLLGHLCSSAGPHSLADLREVEVYSVRKEKKDKSGRVTRTWLEYGLRLKLRGEPDIDLMCGNTFKVRAPVAHTATMIEAARDAAIRNGRAAQGQRGRNHHHHHRPPAAAAAPPPPRPAAAAGGSGGGSECVVCLTSPVEVAFFPCGHVCSCQNCATQLGRRCPMCRERIASTSRIFLAV